MKAKILLSALSLFVAMQAGAEGRHFILKNSADGRSALEVFLPEESRATGRMVVGCPGGGYSKLSLQNEGSDWTSFFLDKGIAYAILTYRMPKGDRTLPMADAMQAIRTVRDSAQAWGVNPSDVGIMGFSAGGHLASTTATHAPLDARPNFQILFYPVISMVERDSHKGSVVNFLGEERGDKKLQELFSNDRQVAYHTTPPAILLMAADDTAVPVLTNGLRYYQSLLSKGIPAALHVYPSGGHGFGYNPKFRFHEQMMGELSSWLDQLAAPHVGATRVACIGNSITDGFGIPMRSVKGYPAQLAQLLGKGYEVRNYGVSSRTLLNKGDLPYMNEPAWREVLDYRPDVAIVKLGTNDSKTANWQHSGDYEHDLQQMVDSLRGRNKNVKIFLCTPIPAFKPSWTISDSVIANGIAPIVNKVARRNKLHVIDLHTLFAPYGQLMQGDGIHPTDKGARKMAELVYEALKGDDGGIVK